MSKTNHNQKILSRRGPWAIVESVSAYKNAWIEATHHTVIRPDGNEGIYGTVNFKNVAIAILPIDDDGCTWLVGQHRFPLDQYSWEIPEGGAPLGTDPLTSAQRELREEAGIVAREWRPILSMHLSNSVTDERSISYLATGLTFTEAEPEGTEDLKVRRVPFNDVVRMVLSGEITDALAVATILRAKILFDQKM